jgi:hypothetical protein
MFFLKGNINLCFLLRVVLHHEEVYIIVNINVIKYCQILNMGEHG